MLPGRMAIERIARLIERDVFGQRDGQLVQRDADRAAVKVAETQLKAAREGRLLSPTRIRRALTVSRLLAPVVVPVAYRAAMAARGAIDERRADRLGVPLSQLGQFSGQGGQLSARISGAEGSLRVVADKKPKDAARAKHALDFFRWAYASGTEQARSLDYVPLPAELVQQVEAYWAAQLK